MQRAYWSSGTSATPPASVRALLGSVLVLAEERAGSFDDSLDAGGKTNC